MTDEELNDDDGPMYDTTADLMGDEVAESIDRQIDARLAARGPKRGPADPDDAVLDLILDGRQDEAARLSQQHFSEHQKPGGVVGGSAPKKQKGTVG